MYKLIVLVALIVLSSNVDRVSAACVHVQNDDMLEYSCEGGTPADLLNVPETAEKIGITRMSVPRVTSSMFSRFGSNLWVLSCSHCNIIDIDDGAFLDLVNLQQLSLDNNRLRVIKGSWFKGLDFLTFLDLNHNEIETIEDSVFENARYIVDLRVSGNRLECLNLEAMSRLQELQRLFIAENPNFKCPNAVSKFFESRKISLEKDSYWDSITVDLVSPSEQGRVDWRTSTNVPMYRERLLSTSERIDTTEYPDTTRQPYYPTYPSRRPYYPTTTDYWTTTESDVANFDHFTNRHRENPVDPNEKNVPAMEVVNSGASDDFYQTPYYVPKVTNPQMIENYRQMESSTGRNEPSSTKMHETTSTECPNSAGKLVFANGASAISLAIFGLAVRNLLY